MGRYNRILATTEEQQEEQIGPEPITAKTGLTTTLQDIISDPRPDLREDSQFWTRLLTYAAWISENLLGALKSLRLMGARARKQVNGRYRLEPGSEISSEEWAECRAEWLEPYKNELIKLLRWTQQGGIFIQSSLLGGELICLAADPGWPQKLPPGTAVYLPSELPELEHLNPESLLAVHLAKKAVAGQVVQIPEEFKED